MPLLVGYISFPFCLPLASTSASASMLLENMFLIPSVKETPESLRRWDRMEGLRTWALTFSLNRLGRRERHILLNTHPCCRLHSGAPVGLAEAEGRGAASAIPDFQTGDPDPDPAYPEWGSGGLQRDEDLPQGMASSRIYTDLGKVATENWGPLQD